MIYKLLLLLLSIFFFKTINSVIIDNENLKYFCRMATSQPELPKNILDNLLLQLVNPSEITEITGWFEEFFGSLLENVDEEEQVDGVTLFGDAKSKLNGTFANCLKSISSSKKGETRNAKRNRIVKSMKINQQCLRRLLGYKSLLDKKLGHIQGNICESVKFPEYIDTSNSTQFVQYLANVTIFRQVMQLNYLIQNRVDAVFFWSEHSEYCNTNSTRQSFGPFLGKKDLKFTCKQLTKGFDIFSTIFQLKQRLASRGMNTEKSENLVKNLRDSLVESGTFDWHDEGDCLRGLTKNVARIVDKVKGNLRRNAKDKSSNAKHICKIIDYPPVLDVSDPFQVEDFMLNIYINSQLRLLANIEDMLI